MKMASFHDDVHNLYGKLRIAGQSGGTTHHGYCKLHDMVGN
ncbi:hypothetical protein HMPREF1141_1932 [Clostridium sp. MSTE9]|nr:hypothetical protein HMPREF1141_1932 [Clostridium sp. MSTE9]